jgi:hypothetical protein
MVSTGDFNVSGDMSANAILGAKSVAVKWSDIKFGRDDKSVLLTTSLNKDALTAMPDYTAERRQPAPPDTAAAPPASPRPAAPR